MAALKAGAHGYILKGISASHLRAIVTSVAAGEVYFTSKLAAEMLYEFSLQRAPDSFESLTSLEAEILELLSQDVPNHAIGEQLNLPNITVRHHIAMILQKLHARGQT
jgi:two-component system nitrate/nitrite response regulator NarL